MSDYSNNSTTIAMYLGAIAEQIAEQVGEFAGYLAADEPQNGDELVVNPFNQDEYSQVLISALASFLENRKFYQVTKFHADWHYKKSTSISTTPPESPASPESSIT